MVQQYFQSNPNLSGLNEMSKEHLDLIINNAVITDQQASALVAKDKQHSEGQYTHVHLAAEFNNVELLLSLYKAGASVEAKYLSLSVTPLTLVVSKHRLNLKK